MGRIEQPVNSKTMKKGSSKTHVKSRKLKGAFYKSKFQKQLGNSKTGQGFVVTQRKKILRKFHRTHSNLAPNTPDFKPLADDSVNTSASATMGDDVSTVRKHRSHDWSFTRRSPTNDLQRIEIDYQQLQEERKRNMEETRSNLSLREKMIKANVLKRRKESRKFAQRTNRGQLVMAARLEHLLGKLSKNKR